MSLLEAAFISSSRITISLLLNPAIMVTSMPLACISFAMGYAMAQPTPPPTTATFFRPSISVA
ncbi:secreted protein [gut metagenome]|uniref:Secreted protein n=1 Tax=gut metagenome TaxID=749906 RepID=J9FYG4_9ZZZZ